MKPKRQRILKPSKELITHCVYKTPRARAKQRENEQKQHNMEQTANYGLDTVIERHVFNEETGKYVYFFRDRNGKLWKESEGNVTKI